MYGLIGKMNVVSGQRDALIAILLEGVEAMPGCMSYIIANEASLSLPSVQQAIARGRPLIAGFSERIITEPVGGHGLTRKKDD
jgi:quinol monooxygenase YgiN